MQSEGPSPFGPPPRSNALVITVIVCVAAVLVAYFFASGPTAEKSGATAPRPSLPRVESPALAPRQGTPVPSVAVESRPAATVPTSPTTTIYLCKSYAGGLFWSDTTCHQQRATIDRMTSVPSGLPFADQVAIAQGQANEAARLYIAPTPSPAAAMGRESGSGSGAVCATLNRELENLDAMARQPQSGQMQDWIRQQRMQVQGQRTAQRC